MKTLTKTQISVLADKIVSEINKPISEHNILVNKREHSLALSDARTEELGKIVGEKVSLDENGYFRFENWAAREIFSHRILSDYKKGNRVLVTKKSIENEIILQTIDCDDLEGLINNVKQKFEKA